MASYLASLGLQLLGPEIADDIGLLRAVGSGRKRRRRRRRRRHHIKKRTVHTTHDDYDDQHIVVVDKYMGHKFTKFAVQCVAPINERLRKGKISGAQVLGALGVAGTKTFIRTAKALPARAQKLFKGGGRKKRRRRRRHRRNKKSIGRRSRYRRITR